MAIDDVYDLSPVAVTLWAHLSRVDEEYLARKARPNAGVPLADQAENYLRRAVYEVGQLCLENQCAHELLPLASKVRSKAGRPAVNDDPFYWILLILKIEDATRRRGISTALVAAHEYGVKPKHLIGHFKQWGPDPKLWMPYKAIMDPGDRDYIERVVRQQAAVAAKADPRHRSSGANKGSRSNLPVGWFVKGQRPVRKRK